MVFKKAAEKNPSEGMILSDPHYLCHSHDLSNNHITDTECICGVLCSNTDIQIQAFSSKASDAFIQKNSGSGVVLDFFFLVMSDLLLICWSLSRVHATNVWHRRKLKV